MNIIIKTILHNIIYLSSENMGLDSHNANQEVLQNMKLSSHEISILKSLENFYENKNNVDKIIPIIKSQDNKESNNTKLSIRLIDHFITKFSKNNKIVYKLEENNISYLFNIYTSYKQQLKLYQKKHFDPFSRGDRIPFFIGDTCIITTIGQINFFKWFITKKIYDYIINNTSVIENDMNKKYKTINKIKVKIPKTKPLYYNKIKLSNTNNYIENTREMKKDIIVRFCF
jgi:hypothetical protein